MPGPPLSRANLLALGLIGTGTCFEVFEKLASDPVAATAHPWLVPLVVGASTLGHIGADLVAGAIEKKSHAREAAHQLLTNRDIALTQAAAIRRRLEQAANRLDQPSQKAQRKRLLAIAASANEKERWWLTAIQDPFRHELQNLRDQEFTNLIAAHVTGQKPPALDANIWEALLNEAAALVPGEPALDPLLVPVIARKLEGDLAGDFFEAIKADLESGGKAYAAVSLRFFGEILLEVRALSANQAELSAQNRDALERLLQVLPRLDGAMKQIAGAAALLQRIEQLPAELKSQLGSVEQRIRLQLDRMEGKLDELLALVRELLKRSATARASRPPFQLPRPAHAGEFFGRKKLLEDLIARLRRREHVSVWGPAGMGKTALAAEAIRAVVGEDENTLVKSPFPDGVVLLDLYTFKADAQKVWDHLAASFAPHSPTDKPARDRAEEACRNRHALIVIEGAEEAHDGDGLQRLLAVLAPENKRLILTRIKSQAAGERLELDKELNRDDSVALLRKLTEQKPVAEPVLAGVCERLGGHPFALTQAGCQLALAEESPGAFLRELQAANLPRLHEQGYEHRTLPWLYGRSARHLTDDAKRVLAAAGILEATKFPLSAAAAALKNPPPPSLEHSLHLGGVREPGQGEGDISETAVSAENISVDLRARESVKLLVSHGLLRLSDGDGEHWEFTHALAYQFARPTDALAQDLLQTLGIWARHEIADAIAQAKNTADFSRLRLVVLFHAAALLRGDVSGVALPSLAKYLIYDCQHTFFALGRLELAASAVQAVRAWMEQQPELRKKSNDWQREWGVSFNFLGNVQQAQGNLGEARSSYQQNLQIAQKLAASDPSNAQWQRDRSVSFERFGDVQQAQGDVGGARSSYEQSLTIRQKLAASDPSNAQWQRDLSVSFSKLGDVQQEQGDLGGARSSYEQYLQIAQKLAASDPSNTEWQRDLSVGFEKLGNVQQAQGDLGEARSSYQQDLQIAQKLAASDPSNAEWQRDLSVSFNKLGGVQQAQGDLDGARSSFEQGLQIAQKFAASDPSNAEWQRDLSVSFNKLGEVQLAQGDLGGARSSYEQDLQIAQKLAASDPSNAQWQRDLFVSRARLGDLARRNGDAEGARKEFTEGLAIMERLAKLDPTNATWRSDLAWVRAQLTSPGL